MHRRLAEPGWFVTGNRILLSRELTERILAESLEPERWGFASWIAQRSRRQVNRFLPLLVLTLIFLMLGASFFLRRVGELVDEL